MVVISQEHQNCSTCKLRVKQMHRTRSQASIILELVKRIVLFGHFIMRLLLVIIQHSSELY
uniref:Uncharacterized protein n=1 Tax=Cucumis melo TaxID=3656 RepID=A0A9I9E649_CUCME